MSLAVLATADGPRDRTSALRIVLTTELVGRAEMSLLFPTSEIWSECVAGLTKCHRRGAELTGDAGQETQPRSTSNKPCRPNDTL